MDPVIVSNLLVKRGDEVILHDVHFSIKPGEFVALVGQSGSGKTTLLYALSGLIHVEGEVAVPSKVGMVFQDHILFPWLTVAENIAFGLENKNTSEKDRLVDEYLELIGLSEKKYRYPKELSGGQVQRVALARSLVIDPDLLLLDEPFGALDEYTRERMQQWLLNIWALRSKTVIFVTHNIEEALFLADRVFIIRDGTVKKVFSVSFKRPRSSYTRFSSEMSVLRREVGQAIQQ